MGASGSHLVVGLLPSKNGIGMSVHVIKPLHLRMHYGTVQFEVCVK